MLAYSETTTPSATTSAVAAHLAALADLRLVPAQPDAAMWEAGQQADAAPGDSYTKVYCAMVDAAPRTGHVAQLVEALGPLVEAVADWAMSHGGLPTSVRAAYQRAVEALGLGESTAWAVDRIDEAAAMGPTPYELGAQRARSGVQEIFVPTDGCAGLPADSPVQEGDKPVCRVVWAEDVGDPSVGIFGQSYWALAPDQRGTLLADLFAPPQSCAGMPRPSLVMMPLTEGLPPCDSVERVLVYTEGVDFQGEQFSDIKADQLHPESEGDLDARSEVVAAATHWAHLPRPSAIESSAAASRTPAASWLTLDEAVPANGDDVWVHTTWGKVESAQKDWKQGHTGDYFKTDGAGELAMSDVRHWMRRMKPLPPT